MSSHAKAKRAKRSAVPPALLWSQMEPAYRTFMKGGTRALLGKRQQLTDARCKRPCRTAPWTTSGARMALSYARHRDDYPSEALRTTAARRAVGARQRRYRVTHDLTAVSRANRAQLNTYLQMRRDRSGTFRPKLVPRYAVLLSGDAAFELMQGKRAASKAASKAAPRKAAKAGAPRRPRSKYLKLAYPRRR